MPAGSEQPMIGTLIKTLLTLLQQVLENKATHIHRVAWGSVVHRLVLGVCLVVQHGGAVRPVCEGRANVLAHYHAGQTHLVTALRAGFAGKYSNA